MSLKASWRESDSLFAFFELILKLNEVYDAKTDHSISGL